MAVAEMTEPTICPWTGAAFEPVQRGAHAKVFASNAARAEAHKAARQFTEWLIETGRMTWPMLRAWADNRSADPSSYTAPEPRRPAVQGQLLLDLGEPA